MNACAVKPTLPFVTKKTIERTPVHCNVRFRKNREGIIYITLEMAMSILKQT